MSDKSERKGYSFELFLVVLTATLAGFVSWAVTQIQLTADHNNRLFTARLACFEKFVKDIEHFRSTSFIYFLDLAGEILGQQAKNLEQKHVAFHDSNADIRATTATARVLFSKPVAAKAEALVYYLQSTQWETIVQSEDFRAKFLAEHDKDPKAFRSTEVIMREVKYENYLTLTNDLMEGMAEELKKGNVVNAGD